MKRFGWALLAFLAWPAVQPALATSVTIFASKDNTLYLSDVGELSNGQGEYLFIGNNSGANTRRTVISFPIADHVPAGATINSIQLQMHVSRARTSTQYVTRLYRLLGDWGEGASDAESMEGPGAPAQPGDATWQHRFWPDVHWINPGGDFSPTISGARNVGGFGSYTWPSTAQMVADAQLWLNDPSQNFGWLIQGNESANGTARRFDSSESPDGTITPRIFVDYTPAPEPTSAMWLALSATLCVRRRKPR